jgi:hypothetical protein
MHELWIALGLVLVLEGAIYTLFPRQMIEMLKKVPELSPLSLRAAGLVAIAAGWLVVWWAKH